MSVAICLTGLDVFTTDGHLDMLQSMDCSTGQSSDHSLLDLNVICTINNLSDCSDITSWSTMYLEFDNTVHPRAPKGQEGM